MALRGPSNWRPRAERVPIMIDPEIRERLRLLLFEDDMRGVGYSEFLLRAITAAEQE